MVKSTPRRIADHKTVEVQTAKPYRPYDRLVLRNPRGRTLWTVLSCKRVMSPRIGVLAA